MARYAIRAADAGDAHACESIVEASGEHFAASVGPEVADAVRGGRDGWVATDGAGGVVGFVLVERRFPGAAEIVHAAVARDRRSAGIGTRLVTAVLTVLARDGVRAVLVKTLDETAGYPWFDRTRAFWRRLGFVQVDLIDPLPGWQPGNPAALLVRGLTDPSAGAELPGGNMSGARRTG